MKMTIPILKTPGKSYDNRWMHRPIIDWKKNARAHTKGTIEHKVFSQTKKLIDIRKSLESIADFKNLTWLPSQNKSIVGFVRFLNDETVYCFFNFSPNEEGLSYYSFGAFERRPKIDVRPLVGKAYQNWRSISEALIFKPYQFYILTSS